MCWYWYTRGCNLAAHSSIYASFILRKGLTRFQLLNLGLRIIECRNSSDILEWGSGAIQIGNITLIAPNHLYARIGYPQVPIAGNHRLSLLVHHSSLHHHSLGSIHLKFLSFSDILFSVEVSADLQIKERKYYKNICKFY